MSLSLYAFQVWLLFSSNTLHWNTLKTFIFWWQTLFCLYRKLHQIFLHESAFDLFNWWRLKSKMSSLQLQSYKSAILSITYTHKVIIIFSNISKFWICPEPSSQLVPGEINIHNSFLKWWNPSLITQCWQKG